MFPVKWLMNVAGEGYDVDALRPLAIMSSSDRSDVFLYCQSFSGYAGGFQHRCSVPGLKPRLRALRVDHHPLCLEAFKNR